MKPAKVAGLMLGGFAIAATAITIATTALLGDIRSNLTNTAATPPPATTTTPETPQPAQGTNALILGSDATHPGTPGRSDVMILAHITEDRDQVTLISIPRDLWATIPGHGEAKINAAYAHGGPALAEHAVEQLFGVPIHYTAEIDLTGFAGLVDTVGGITVHNDHPSTVHGHAFPAGPVALDSAAAQAYVRQRHGLPAGDTDRQQRHRAVVTAIADKARAEPWRLPWLTVNAAQHATITGLAAHDMPGLAWDLRNTRTTHAEFPVARHDTSPDGQAIAVADREQLADLSRRLYTDQP